MDVRGLGYIGIDVLDVEGWGRYAASLGAMVIPDETGLRVRIDERPWRVSVRTSEDREGLAFVGWELPDAAALDEAVADLDAAGCTTAVASEDLCARRGVRGLVRTTDPSGYPVELFHGPVLDHEPFVSPVGAAGFVTGSLGMGHVVLAATRPAETVEFYTGLLGFRVSDYWRPGGDEVAFLRCNPRHHSLALVPASEPALYHYMWEARTLDDVGRALDRLGDAGTPISMGLGRHTNDEMVSFYSTTPSGFDVELGCGGRLIDEATWTVCEITAPSAWGHRRSAGP